MSQEYQRRVDDLKGRRMAVTVAWIDGGEARSEVIEGVVHGAFGLGRESFITLDRGAVALGASRIVMMKEIASPE